MFRYALLSYTGVTTLYNQRPSFPWALYCLVQNWRLSFSQTLRGLPAYTLTTITRWRWQWENPFHVSAVILWLNQTDVLHLWDCGLVLTLLEPQRLLDCDCGFGLDVFKLQLTIAEQFRQINFVIFSLSVFVLRKKTPEVLRSLQCLLSLLSVTSALLSMYENLKS